MHGGRGAFPSLTPTPKPSRHYFIVLTEMKKRDDGSLEAGWENVGSMKVPAALVEELSQLDFASARHEYITERSWALLKNTKLPGNLL